LIKSNADIVFATANPLRRTKIYNRVNYDIEAGQSIFAHSRPDSIGTPREILSSKEFKAAQILYPAYFVS
jgi:hypothetical protein